MLSKGNIAKTMMNYKANLLQREKENTAYAQRHTYS